MYYLKNGNPCTLLDVAKRFGDKKYRQVALTKLKGKDNFISTVWLGIDLEMQMRKGKPLIFETMVQRDGFREIRRYSTLEEAKKGHKEEVSKAAKRL